MNGKSESKLKSTKNLNIKYQNSFFFVADRKSTLTLSPKIQLISLLLQANYYQTQESLHSENSVACWVHSLI